MGNSNNATLPHSILSTKRPATERVAVGTARMELKSLRDWEEEEAGRLTDRIAGRHAVETRVTGTLAGMIDLPDRVLHCSRE